MKFSDCIIDELISGGVIPAIECVQSISFAPPAPYDQYDCSVRINDRNLISDSASFAFELISECCTVGNYINLQLNWTNLVDKLTSYITETDKEPYGYFESKFNGKNISVEHTSITPVYPINLATFRSSVIGEALKNMFEFLGAKVQTHFFVEDLARQIELLNRGVEATQVDLDSLPVGDKVDHLIGKLFAATYSKCKNNTLVMNRLSAMFPYAGDVCFEKEIDNSSLLDNDKRKYLCEKCLIGHKETLQYTGIAIDSYDYESEFAYDFDEVALKEPGVLRTLIAHSEKIPYYLRNCAYFAGMKLGCDEFYTIISDRQRAAINDTLDALSSTEGINVVFFGDVLVSDDDEKNALDSIKEGAFHSVDQYIETMAKSYNRSRDCIVKALKFKLLSTRLSKGCYIDDTEFNQHDCFFAILDFVQDIKSGRNQSNSHKPEYDDTVKPLCRKMIQFEDVIHKVAIEKCFNLLADYVESLYFEVKTYIEVSDDVLCLDSKLGRAVVSIFDTAFEILDIE